MTTYRGVPRYPPGVFTLASLQGDKISQDLRQHGAKRKNYIGRQEGCTNIVVQGGVCVRHGARVKKPKKSLLSKDDTLLFDTKYS